MTPLTTNFNLEEFNCKDGVQVPEELMPNVELLAKNLQVIRDHIGEPLHINSGYRTPAWNKKVQGKTNSYHMKAMAADLTTKNKTPKQLAALIERLIEKRLVKQGGIGIYPGFCHYDIRGYKARW